MEDMNNVIASPKVREAVLSHSFAESLEQLLSRQSLATDQREQ